MSQSISSNSISSSKTHRNRMNNTNPLTVSLDFDADTAIRSTKPYPSIQEYYHSLSSPDKRMQEQKGLSNYSSLQLGDDRIMFKETVLNEAFRLPIEEKLHIDSPSLRKSPNIRKRDYDDALEKVGNAELDRMEKMMKEKLILRHESRGSFGSILKVFKFFDRESTGEMSIEVLTRTLEFLGFQFSEVAMLALFSRFDSSNTGLIHYVNFIQQAMFYDPEDEATGKSMYKLRNQISKKDEHHDAPDLAKEEIVALQKIELRKLFDKVDRLKRDALDVNDLELLLMAMGYRVSNEQLSECVTHILSHGCNGDNDITFTAFFDWWTSDSGETFLRRS